MKRSSSKLASDGAKMLRSRNQSPSVSSKDTCNPKSTLGECPVRSASSASEWNLTGTRDEGRLHNKERVAHVASTHATIKDDSIAVNDNIGQHATQQKKNNIRAHFRIAGDFVMNIGLERRMSFNVCTTGGVSFTSLVLLQARIRSKILNSLFPEVAWLWKPENRHNSHPKQNGRISLNATHVPRATRLGRYSFIDRSSRTHKGKSSACTGKVF